MPQAKQPSSGAARSSGLRSPATRREVEREIARFEKMLDGASDALQALGRDLGRGAQDAYTDMLKTMRALRRDAQKTNRALLKDFEKLRATVTPSGTTSRSSTRSTARSGGARASASPRTGGSRSTATRSSKRSTS
jgi:hypothetical protein